MKDLHCLFALFVLITIGRIALAEEFNHQQIQLAPLLIPWNGSEDEFFDPIAPDQGSNARRANNTIQNNLKSKKYTGV